MSLPSRAIRPFAYDGVATELPKLRISSELAGQQNNDMQLGRADFESVLSVPPRGSAIRSPSSPCSFFTQPDLAKLGLTPLVQAAEEVCKSELVTLKRDSTQPPLPSILHAMGGYPIDASTPAKQSRVGSEVNSNVQHYYKQLGHSPSPQHLYNHDVSSSTPKVMCSNKAELSSPKVPAFSSVSVWETVLITGKFPSDFCISDNGEDTSNASQPSLHVTNQLNRTINADRSWMERTYEVKQGSALTQTVHRGEIHLPVNMSLGRFVTDSLQRKSMSAKKCEYLRACHNGHNEDSEIVSHQTFNPLSLKSIMNTEPSSSVSESHRVRPVVARRQISMSSTFRKLKRSDYSQHGMVRSGRWSVEEETYAKAMIEAFKTGYLPLHGKVSLRKFLSEMLVCHPMRISKKFVGYVRKYHWYRAAAGKFDQEAKRQTLNQLIHLERVFWTSLLQSNGLSMLR